MKESKSVNVYVYGAGHLYNCIRPVINASGINILGILLSDPVFSYVDGCKVLNPDNADYSLIDYVVIAAYDWKELYNTLILNDCPVEKIILGKAFINPDFILKEYLRLQKSNCSILCNNCIGGMISEELGLRFLSPTKNCATEDNKGFCDIANNLSSYLNITMVKYDDWEPKFSADFYKRGIWGNCVWEFPHNDDINEAIDVFNNKINLINTNNVAVIMTLYCDEDISIFKEIDCKKKVGIYYKQVNDKDIVWLRNWSQPKVINKYHANWRDYAPAAMTNAFGHESPVNWIKFLLGEEDYLRNYS